MSPPMPGAVAVFCREYVSICRTPEQAAARILGIERGGNCRLRHQTAAIEPCSGCGRLGIERHEGIYPDESYTPGADLAIFDGGICSDCLTDRAGQAKVQL